MAECVCVSNMTNIQSLFNYFAGILGSLRRTGIPLECELNLKVHTCSPCAYMIALYLDPSVYRVCSSGEQEYECEVCSAGSIR